MDISSAAGLDRLNAAGGSIMDDFDSDGLLDIVISVVNVCEPMHYYHNNGDGSSATGRSGPNSAANWAAST